MIVLILLNKLKSFLLIFVHLFNRALCCIRRKRRPSFSDDSVPLTHVGVISDRNPMDDASNWTDWGAENDLQHPQTVQDHIELYRKQKAIAQQNLNETNDENLNFFEDMTPKIQRPPKLFIPTTSGAGSAHGQFNNRLNFAGDVANLVPASELGEWEENGGWEGETLDWAAQEALREKKRQDRERRLWQQQQKRLEKAAKLSLGSKISA